MGSISTYSTAAGARYRARYRKLDGSQTEKRGFRTKGEAALFLAEAEVHRAAGDLLDVSGARAPIGPLGDDWLASQVQLKPSSWAVVEVAWRIHVVPVWATWRVGDIRFSDIQKWINELSATRSATVTRRAHGVLAGILDFAVRDHRIRSNPARGVKLPRRQSKQRQYLTHQQVELLAQQAASHATLVLLLAYTGLRWGEAVALRTGSLDRSRRRLLIRANAVNVRGTIVPGTPKSHAVRTVPYPAFLDQMMSAQCEEKRDADLVFGNGDVFMPTPTPRDGWFASARARAARIDSEFPSHLTLHDLRHTAASLAIAAGANVKEVQRMLGHASAAMTLDTYADLFVDDLSDVARRLDSARRAGLTDASDFH